MSDSGYVRFVGYGPRQPGFGPRFFGPRAAGFAGPWRFGPRVGFGPARPLKKSEVRIVKRLRALAFTLMSSRGTTTKVQRQQLAQALDRALVEVQGILDGADTTAEPADATA